LFPARTAARQLVGFDRARPVVIVLHHPQRTVGAHAHPPGHHVACNETPLFFECSPCVCPEPVLVKCSFLNLNGSKRPLLLTCHAVRRRFRVVAVAGVRLVAVVAPDVKAVDLVRISRRCHARDERLPGQVHLVVGCQPVCACASGGTGDECSAFPAPAVDSREAEAREPAGPSRRGAKAADGRQHRQAARSRGGTHTPCRSARGRRSSTSRTRAPARRCRCGARACCRRTWCRSLESQYYCPPGPGAQRPAESPSPAVSSRAAAAARSRRRPT
jgi:hypothetical protein